MLLHADEAEQGGGLVAIGGLQLGLHVAGARRCRPFKTSEPTTAQREERAEVAA